MSGLRILAFAAIALFAGGATRAGAQATSDAGARANYALAHLVNAAGRTVTLAQQMQRFKIPAVSVAIVDGSRVVWTGAFGHVGANDMTPVTPHTLFQAGSVSKPVASIGMLALVQSGRAQLDEPINSQLTTWKLPSNALTQGDPVTLRELMTHTAGINNHGFGGYARGARLPTLEQVLDGTPPANNPPIRVVIRPGTKFDYSGGGITVMQQLMVDLAGPFPQYMERAVLGPLGMSESTYEQPLPASRFSEAAHGTQPSGQPVPGAWHVYPEMAAAGLWTTPSDLARVVISLQRSYDGDASQPLSQATVRQMLTNGKLGWGLGVAVRRFGNVVKFSHDGVNDGFDTYLEGFSSGQGVVVMMDQNTGNKVNFQITGAIAKAFGFPTMR